MSAAYRPGSTPLDQAIAALASGRPADALGWLIPILNKDPFQPIAVFALGDAAARLGQFEVALGAFELSTRLSLRRGMHVAALAAAAQSRQITEEGWNVRASDIAKALREHSEANTSTPPPPLRTQEEVKKIDGSDEALLREAAALMLRVVGSADSAPVYPSSAMPVLGAIDADDLIVLMHEMKVHFVDDGQVVLAEGELGDDVFWIARGELEVRRSSDDAPIAQLTTGGMFGELALFTRAPRSATVRATRPSILLSLSVHNQADGVRPELTSRLASSARARLLTNASHPSTMLGSLEPSVRKALLAESEPVHFEQDETIISAGADADSVFCIVNGAVAMLAHEGSSRLLFSQLEVGDFAGEISVVLRRKMPFDLVAVSPTLCLKIGKYSLLKLFSEHPRLLLTLYQAACTRLDDFEGSLRESVTPVVDDVLV